MTTPNVTLIVVPRERFSYAQTSLNSIYEHTQIDFNLIYVDGNSPKELKQSLEQQSLEKGFKLIRTERYLYPNEARNIGLQHADTQYIVFVDNDVVVSPGWLKALVQCAEDTDAAVVGPLMCQHEPIHQEIHFAGGESHVWVDKLGRRRIREKMLHQGKQLADVRDRLQREPTELAEFHCVLVRRSIFDDIGQLDEAMRNTKEHLDFCMTVRGVGKSVYFDPAAVVTYVPGPPQQLADVHYYMLRWSDAWTLESLKHLREKWDLVEDGYFKSKYKKLGWRRYGTLTKPLARKLTFGMGSNRLTDVIDKLEHRVNRYLTNRHRQLTAKSR
ncbi:glycosyltransferase family 2 [Leptolyngbya sp. Heron Island J]|uniref:glycosyltransferase family 2 protein n=1 Tax=Leptolyngbya sp. Heron Island J TaxID=1385935 RepID=UPI0003B97E45|nr:glycosyltransferase [Leptolyngbya sp. Heron Island J]ESA39151.1 glycosyltransferase family 2 [Leptolyngbya sp. Heron Island J]